MKLNVTCLTGTIKKYELAHKSGNDLLLGYFTADSKLGEIVNYFNNLNEEANVNGNTTNQKTIE